MIGKETIRCCRHNIGCRSEIMATHVGKYGWVKRDGRWFCPTHAKEVYRGNNNRSK